MRAAPLLLAAALAGASCGPQVSADPVADFAAWRGALPQAPATETFAVSFGGSITTSGWVGSQRFQLGGSLDWGPDIPQRLEFDFEAAMQDLPVPSPLGDRIAFGGLLVNDGVKTWLEPRVDQDWLSRLLADLPELQELQLDDFADKVFTLRTGLIRRVQDQFLEMAAARMATPDRLVEMSRLPMAPERWLELLAEHGEVRYFARAGDEVEVVFGFPELEAELLEVFADLPRMPGQEREEDRTGEPFELRVRFGADDGLPRAVRATYEARQQGVQFKLRFDLTGIRVNDARGRPYGYDEGRREVPLDAVLGTLLDEVEQAAVEGDLPF